MAADERRWQVGSARTLMLAVFGVGWLVAVVFTAINNHGDVPGATWGAFGVGVGAIMAAFRVDDIARRDREERKPQPPVAAPPPLPPSPSTPAPPPAEEVP